MCTRTINSVRSPRRAPCVCSRQLRLRQLQCSQGNNDVILPPALGYSAGPLPSLGEGFANFLDGGATRIIADVKGAQGKEHITIAGDSRPMDRKGVGRSLSNGYTSWNDKGSFGMARARERGRGVAGRSEYLHNRESNVCSPPPAAERKGCQALHTRPGGGCRLHLRHRARGNPHGAAFPPTSQAG